VEGKCQAHLSEWRGRKVGTYDATGCFSFQASKNLNSGEGGARLSWERLSHEAILDPRVGSPRQNFNSGQ
jgi:dTDP-4-amino-4,6-dideoxygalactose transaminase